MGLPESYSAVSKYARWATGAFRARLVGMRPGWQVHYFSRFDGFPTVRTREGARVQIERRVRIFSKVRFTLEGKRARISIGERTFLNRNVEIICAQAVSIGADCAISWDVLITDTDFHTLSGSERTAPVQIGDRVWIGAGAAILKGVRLGDGVVVAAKSVVTKSVPARSLVAGNPARVVRTDVEWEL